MKERSSCVVVSRKKTHLISSVALFLCVCSLVDIELYMYICIPSVMI